MFFELFQWNSFVTPGCVVIAEGEDFNLDKDAEPQGTTSAEV